MQSIIVSYGCQIWQFIWFHLNMVVVVVVVVMTHRDLQTRVALLMVPE